jgi:hypothetical protein
MSSAPCPGAAPGKWPSAMAGRPVCPKRDLPIPYIAEIGVDGVGHFTIIDDDRARECLKGRLCAMCARQMGDEVALIGDVTCLDPDGYFIEPPVHEMCGLDALAGLCPFISRERVPRRPHGDDVTLVGIEPEELYDVGRTIAKRPMIMAITRAYQAAFAVNHVGGLTMVYQPGPVARVRRYAWDADGLAAEVRPPRVVRTQRRRPPPRSRR